MDWVPVPPTTYNLHIHTIYMHTLNRESALRRCIEQFSLTTRFFIIVENKSRLLNPILSRFCEIFVPDYIENGKIINLHVRFSSSCLINKKDYSIFKTLFEN